MKNRVDRRDPEEMLPLPPADFQVLLLLAKAPLHPYGISKAVERPALGVRLEIGSLYRMLNRMMTNGLIEESGGHAVGGKGPAARRRVFRMTRYGRRVAKAEARRLEAVLEAAREQRFLPQARSG